MEQQLLRVINSLKCTCKTYFSFFVKMYITNVYIWNTSTSIFFQSGFFFFKCLNIIN